MEKVEKVSGGWFTAAYFLLMMISPVLNNAIENIFQKSRQEDLLALKILAIGIALSASPFFLISGVGTGESCTIVLLTFVYVATGIFKRLGVGVNFRALVVAIALYLLVIGVMYTGIVVFFAQDGHYYRVLRIVSYNLPHIWIIGIMIVVFFATNVSINGWLANVATFCAPSMFAIYLIHHTTSFGRLLYLLPERWLSQSTDLPVLLIVVLSAAMCFTACLFVDFIRRYLFYLLRQLWGRWRSVL